MDCSIKYDETTQVGTDYGNQNEVGMYDERMRKLRNMDAEAKDIREALRLSTGSTVWEIGAGTGECALALSAGVRHVYASDVSPAMLEFARQKADQRHIRNVTFEEGGFLSGFRPDHPVNGVVTQLALHHLPDFWKSRALANIAGSLCPHGRLYLRDIVFPSATVDYDAFFKEMIAQVRARAGDEMAQRVTQHIRREFSTLDWILEGIITRCGLRIVGKESTGFFFVYVCEK